MYSWRSINSTPLYILPSFKKIVWTCFHESPLNQIYTLNKNIQQGYFMFCTLLGSQFLSIGQMCVSPFFKTNLVCKFNMKQNDWFFFSIFTKYIHLYSKTMFWYRFPYFHSSNFHISNDILVQPSSLFLPILIVWYSTIHIWMLLLVQYRQMGCNWWRFPMPVTCARMVMLAVLISVGNCNGMGKIPKTPAASKKWVIYRYFITDFIPSLMQNILLV